MASWSNLQAQVESAADEIRLLIAARGRAVVVIDGSLPARFLDALVSAPGIDWTLVIIFLAGEWVGVEAEEEGSLRRQIIDRMLMRVPIVEFHAPRGEAANPQAVVYNYTQHFIVRGPELAILGSFADSARSEDKITAVSMPAALVEIDGRMAIALTAAAWRRVPMVLWVSPDQ